MAKNPKRKISTPPAKLTEEEIHHFNLNRIVRNRQFSVEGERGPTLPIVTAHSLSGALLRDYDRAWRLELLDLHGLVQGVDIQCNCCNDMHSETCSGHYVMIKLDAALRVVRSLKHAKLQAYLELKQREILRNAL